MQFGTKNSLKTRIFFSLHLVPHTYHDVFLCRILLKRVITKKMFKLSAVDFVPQIGRKSKNNAHNWSRGVAKSGGIRGGILWCHPL